MSFLSASTIRRFSVATNYIQTGTVLLLGDFVVTI